jgi:Mannosyl-glycoprotein endo-beta-N-acetylglucosaminidase/LysM domain
MNSHRFILLSFFIAACTTLCKADEPRNTTVFQYIEKYAPLAVAEMHRTGVPASITLAQGIAESSFGNSQLAYEANNHFGVKCNNDWKGASYQQEDDDKNTDGELIKSCFRKYETPEQSYRDHSDFLLNKSRYAALFKLNRTDYKAWAMGLKEAGYATLPTYPNILIANIERYELYKYDKMTQIPTNVIAEQQNTGTNIFINSLELASIDEVEGQSGIYRHNRLKMVVADAMDTPESIAAEFKIDVFKLRGFNDLSATDKLIPFQFVYLEPKRHWYKGKTTIHVVQPNENMYLIAQFYGVKISHLRSHNGLVEGQEPSENALIYLSTEAPARPLLRSSTALKNVAQPTQPKPSMGFIGTKPLAE